MPQNAVLITALIMERPLCLDCIGTKTGLNDGAVQDYLKVMERVLRVRRDHDRCRACGAITAVVSTTPPSP